MLLLKKTSNGVYRKGPSLSAQILNEKSALSWYQSRYNSLYSQVSINPDTTLSVFLSWYRSRHNSLYSQVSINPVTALSVITNQYQSQYNSLYSQVSIKPDTATLSIEIQLLQNAMVYNNTLVCINLDTTFSVFLKLYL